MCDEHDTRDYATGSHPIVASLRHSSEAGAGRLGAPYSPECDEAAFPEVRRHGDLGSSHEVSADGIMLGGGTG
jgi:hypothetical protein